MLASAQLNPRAQPAGHKMPGNGQELASHRANDSAAREACTRAALRVPLLSLALPGSRGPPCETFLRCQRVAAAMSRSAFPNTATSAAFNASTNAGGSVAASVTSAVSVFCSSTFTGPDR
jgi:hypothetical protein